MASDEIKKALRDSGLIIPAGGASNDLMQDDSINWPLCILFCKKGCSTGYCTYGCILGCQTTAKA